MTVIRPKNIPGTLEIMTGQSLYVLFQPYPVHNDALIIATRGCKNPTGCPEKLLMICGMYEIYIQIHMIVANLLKIFSRRILTGEGASSPSGYLDVSILMNEILFFESLNIILTQAFQECKYLMCFIYHCNVFCSNCFIVHMNLLTILVDIIICGVLLSAKHNGKIVNCIKLRSKILDKKNDV